MIRPTVVYDASVLYPAPLRDLLMYIALNDLVQAKWTEAIHDEWTKNVLKQRPDLKPEQLKRTRVLMNAHVRDSIVEGYEHLIPCLRLPDPNDRHVLAAAICCQANVILTWNLKDFPSPVLAVYGIQAENPDSFLSDLLDRQPGAFCKSVQQHRASLKNPPKTVRDYLKTLSGQGLKHTVKKLRHFAKTI